MDMDVKQAIASSISVLSSGRASSRYKEFTPTSSQPPQQDAHSLSTRSREAYRSGVSFGAGRGQLSAYRSLSLKPPGMLT